MTNKLIANINRPQCKANRLQLAFIFIIMSSMYTNAQSLNSWCNQKPRAQFGTLSEIKTSHPWFKVYDVGNKVLAIAEPYNYQEVMSYLIIGSGTALLFDTGMGMDTISAVVKELTNLPVIVLNSHTHYDHIGGNAEFNHILAMNTPYTIHNAQNGWPHSVVKDEVTPEAFCRQKLPGLDTANYHIRPFTITQFVDDGHIINLGGRQLQIISTPGHAPDAIMLYDKQNGYLFTGDSFYEGPIYLFADGSDAAAFGRSIARAAALEPKLTMLFTQHNTPQAKP